MPGLIRGVYRRRIKDRGIEFGSLLACYIKRQAGGTRDKRVLYSYIVINRYVPGSQKSSEKLETLLTPQLNPAKFGPQTR